MIYVAKTEGGMVRGLPSGDPLIISYRGIPFAAPPVGKNRWRVPQPVIPWEGVKDCYYYGPAAMMVAFDRKGVGFNPVWDGFYDKEFHRSPDTVCSEDCLQLNVWTPAKTPDDRLPVMIWIYGGGLQEGYTGEMEYDGEMIASRGVVFVSINYRVNVFGFLAHPEITAECGGKNCGNFGLYDQKAGIDWVGRNIAAFGGDPDNITIFGQSAGGRSTIAQVVSPLNEGGYIKKAISQSATGINIGAGHGRDYYTLEQAEQQGVRFFEYMGVKTLEEARALPAEYVRDKGIEWRMKKLGVWQMIIDGTFLPNSPVDRLASNQRLQIPIITGSTTGEFINTIDGKTMDELIANIKNVFGEFADEVLKIAEVEKGDLEHSLNKVRVNGSPLGARLWAMRAADDGLPFYLYQFDPEIPGPDDPGVFHSADLWFVFDCLFRSWRPFTGKQYDLARQVCNYWTNFVKYGDPNGNDKDGRPMPTWLPFTKDGDHCIVFGDTVYMGKEKGWTDSTLEVCKVAADATWRKVDPTKPGRSVDPLAHNVVISSKHGK